MKEEMLRFLGKVFFNKVKQRRAEMELTQENMSKSMNKSKSKKKNIFNRWLIFINEYDIAKPKQKITKK